MTTSAEPPIIILAAGRSSRMGAFKLLLPLGDRPVIAHVVSTALATPLRPILVVIGHMAPLMRAQLPAAQVTIIENSRYAEGQSTSLHAALAELPPSACGAIVMLGDQPLITPSQLMRLATAVSETSAPLIAACYSGQRGNPVYFGRSCFPELLQVSGDTGGREIMARHQHELVLAEMDDPTAALDIDDAEAYAHVRDVWNQRHPVL